MRACVRVCLRACEAVCESEGVDSTTLGLHCPEVIRRPLVLFDLVSLHFLFAVCLALLVAIRMVIAALFTMCCYMHGFASRFCITYHRQLVQAQEIRFCCSMVLVYTLHWTWYTHCCVSKLATAGWSTHCIVLHHLLLSARVCLLFLHCVFCPRCSQAHSLADRAQTT